MLGVVEGMFAFLSIFYRRISSNNLEKQLEIVIGRDVLNSGGWILSYLLSMYIYLFLKWTHSPPYLTLSITQFKYFAIFIVNISVNFSNFFSLRSLNACYLLLKLLKFVYPNCCAISTLVISISTDAICAITLRLNKLSLIPSKLQALPL